ncbi:MAG: hypothetical protein Ct9H300mP1_32760 [Planctomycetaceae bacterium]|nr:MAG: hypothetical protein Ct9H300mP1_32760 [Planctomycetaceae bacterium]
MARLNPRVPGRDRRHGLPGQRGPPCEDRRAGPFSLAPHVLPAPSVGPFIAMFPGDWEVDDHDSWVDDGWPTKRSPWMFPLTFKQGFAIYASRSPSGS